MSMNSNGQAAAKVMRSMREDMKVELAVLSTLREIRDRIEEMMQAETPKPKLDAPAPPSKWKFQIIRGSDGKATEIIATHA